MRLRRDNQCTRCSVALPAGTSAQWDATARKVTCLGCAGRAGGRVDVPRASPPEVQPTPIEVGTPGASARAEADRRRAKQAERIESRWGSGAVGRLARAIATEPQTTSSWEVGAVGEERVAAILERRLKDRAVVLHDRRVPGTRGNIDHVVIAPSGVWVVDAKRYTGRVERRDVGKFFRRDIRLYVGGRDRTRALHGLGWQLEAVSELVDETGAPVQSMVCLTGADWPAALMVSKPFRVEGVWVTYPRKLATQILHGRARLSRKEVQRLARQLATAFPPA